MLIDEIIDEIATLFHDNLKLFLQNDEYLVNLKKYCNDEGLPYLPYLTYLPYNYLIYFAEEALADLINVDHLYDFRDMD